MVSARLTSSGRMLAHSEIWPMTVGTRKPTMRLRPLAFTASAMVAVIGAVAVAFYVFNLSAESIFLDRERNDAVAERQILREAFERERLPGMVLRINRRGRLHPPEAHYGAFDLSGRHIAGDLLELPKPLVQDAWSVIQSRTKEGSVQLHATTTRLSDGFLLVIARDDAAQV